MTKKHSLKDESRKVFIKPLWCSLTPRSRCLLRLVSIFSLGDLFLPTCLDSTRLIYRDRPLSAVGHQDPTPLISPEFCSLRQSLPAHRQDLPPFQLCVDNHLYPESRLRHHPQSRHSHPVDICGAERVPPRSERSILPDDWHKPQNAPGVAGAAGGAGSIRLVQISI